MNRKLKVLVTAAVVAALAAGGVVSVSAIRCGPTMTAADFTPGGRIIWDDVTPECRASIKRWEGCSLDAILDNNGKDWAQGYGHIVCPVSQGKPKPISQAQAEKWFEEDLHSFDYFITKWCADQGIKALTRGQYSCLVSFLYQFGPYHTGPNGERYMYEPGWWGDRFARYVRGDAGWQQFADEAVLYDRSGSNHSAAIRERRLTEAGWAKA